MTMKVKAGFDYVRILSFKSVLFLMRMRERDSISDAKLIKDNLRGSEVSALVGLDSFNFGIKFSFNKGAKLIKYSQNINFLIKRNPNNIFRNHQQII